MKSLRVLAFLGLVSAAAVSTASADVQLSIDNGRVSLTAKDATVRQILTEWARVGQTRIVNVERIPGGPLTLELKNMPEDQALNLLLRSVSGYLAAPRPTMRAPVVATGVPWISETSHGPVARGIREPETQPVRSRTRDRAQSSFISGKAAEVCPTDSARPSRSKPSDGTDAPGRLGPPLLRSDASPVQRPPLQCGQLAAWAKRARR